jgi:peroxiredoxin family protein
MYRTFDFLNKLSLYILISSNLLTKEGFNTGEVAEMSSTDLKPGIDPNTMSIIVTKGSLDWAYPPFILATTAAAMGLDVTMFFTFYGLPLLMKDLSLQISSLGNPAMKMPMMGMHMGMPNIVSAIPGVDAAASKMMKNLIKKKGVASIPELRELAVEAEVRLIACQMTLDLFEYSKDDMIDGVEIGGAATYIEVATQSHINLFI